MKQKIPSYVHPASYGKTTLAYLIDAACTIAMIFVLYFAFGKTVLLPAQGYEESHSQYLSFMEGSGLTEGDESGTLLTYDASGKDGVPGWQLYQKAIVNYYTVFIPKTDNGAEFYEEDGVLINEDGTYNMDSVNLFVLENVYKLSADGDQLEEGADPYFVLDPTSENPYNVKLADTYQKDVNDATVKSNLKNFFANSDDHTGPYYEAVTHLSKQPAFTALQSLIGLKRYISFLPSFILSPLIFFFLIPIITKDGRTLGKLVAKTAVIGIDGYKAKKINIILHYAILTVVWEFLLVPSTMVGIMGMALLLLIDYLSLILSKSYTSFHDKISRTLVINAKESSWFANEEEEEKFIHDNPDSSVAGFYLEENGHLPGEEARHVEQTPHGLSEDTILDFSTIGQARREAATITSFDEFEKRQNVEVIRPVENAEKPAETKNIERKDEEKGSEE